MKTKPTRHKETNTFKFRPFSERVNDIDVDVFHKVSHRNEVVSEETETFFYQCLQKWNFLNLAENYSNFRKEVTDIITLPQLLNRKQFLIDTLLKYLKLKDPLCLQTIFDLIIAVAKDLQVDFYPYFPEFLTAIVDLLHTKDAEQLEQTFTTLAYLFKFLWRYMIKNINVIFDLLVPLLADTRPVYINNFAAESFAFVVRKVRDKEAFVKLMLKTLEKKENGLDGCGKLLFHVLAGVPGQFHSCAESMLSVYLNALQDPLINQQILFEVLLTVFRNIATEIHSQKCDVLWTVVFKAIDKFSENGIGPLLQLIQIIIQHKGGYMVKDPAAWVKKLGDLLDKYQTNDKLLEEITNTSVITLLVPNIKLLQETNSYLILKLLSFDSQDLLLQITEKLISHSSFETLVLRNILKKTAFSTLDDKFLHLLLKVVETKSPPCLSGINFDKWRRFPLNIKGEGNVKYLSEHLDSLKEGEIRENALKVLVILPHLTSLQKEVYNKIIESLTFLYKRVIEKNEREQQRINFAFLLTMECIVRITKVDDFHTIIKELTSNTDLLSAVISHKNDISILNAFDLSLSYLKTSSQADEFINSEIFEKIHESLASKLGSPNSLLRLTTAHLFSLFSNVPGLVHTSENPNRQNALEIPFLGESEQVTVHKYRDRLLRVQALDYRGVTINQLNSRYLDFPIHWLFGNLYVNFSLLWEPTVQVITSYATKECQQFWSIFLAKLKGEEDVTMVEQPTFGCEILTELSNKVFKVQDKVDFENYKLLLWKCMGQFVSYCEVKNRDYVGLFIDFVEKNFFKSNSEDAKSCNIKKHEKGHQPSDESMNLDLETVEEEAEDLETIEEVVEENAEETEKDFEEKSKEEKGKIDEADNKEKDDEETKVITKSQLSRMERVKLLVAMLQVFGKFTNTRSLYREPEILRIYLDLLSSKNSEIQKAALNCLYTYKYQYLLPYRVQLDNILDEKNLKSELARFQIGVGETAESIQNEHREGLLPILMRILHSKMTQRVGMRTGGKAGGLVRRKTILRFLAGVREDEMMVFVRMAFKPFQNYLPILNVDPKDQSEIDLLQMVQEIFDSVDLESVVPPKRLQSAANLLAVMIEQFGGKMTEKLLPHLLAILICILAQVAGILAKFEQVHSGYLTALRNVRKTCINTIARFFDHFENYKWTASEIDAVFEVAVFPWLDKLPADSVHSPTPLLKLFVAWSHNPRYYPLLVKLNKNNQTPMVFVIKLLLGPKIHKSVEHTILDMLEKMLTLQDFEKDDPDQMEVDENKPPSLLPIVTNKLDILKNDSINYGSAILLPHTTDILWLIQRKLARQTRQGATRIELVILSRISEFAQDSKTCNTLLTLVLPILHRKSGDSEETVIQLLTTVKNLLQRVDKPDIHQRSIQYLLAQISAAPARKMLMQLLEIVVSGDEALKKNQLLLVELNAYDARWIEQPDFQRRLDAFGEIERLIKEDKVTLEFGVAVILNCFFFLKTENDLAMRDRSGQCMKSMGVHLARKFKDSSVDRKYLIDETILTMIRQGIRNKSETVNLQSIAFLGHMAMECPEVHPILRDLNLLTNRQDPEVDFFENMQHLQLHRKARALLKFCSIAKTMTKTPNVRTLTHFILPLASSYLCNEKFVNKNSIVDAAIDTIGIVSKLLPWNQYEIVLKCYLDKLRTSVDFQKQLIRIVVAILDSFHFDLSKYKEVIEETAKAKDKAGLADETVSEVTETSGETEKSAEEPAAEEPEEMEEAMDKQLDEVVAVVEEAEDPATTDILAVEKQTVLSQYMAKRLINSISKGFLPQLHRSIAMRTKHEANHKVNKKRISTDQEEEELMRVPIALAMVKLLQKLPQGMLSDNLRGIFTKICTFLRSRLESVRRTTREILQKIMITLGPDYLHTLLKEMHALLTRGYQVHVLVYTIHAVLVSLKPYFQPKHMSSNLSCILSVCKIDLFGPSADEKEIIGIVKKVSEARSTKSYDIYHILGEFIDQDSIIKVILPLKDVLLRTRLHKTVRKVTETLRQLGLGLADNKFINIKEMIDFLYGVTSESIPQLLPENKKKQQEEEKKKKAKIAKPDIFILAPEPRRRTLQVNARISSDTNAHVMVEFGLRLLHVLLKRDKVNDPEIKPSLDLFVPVLNDCLKSRHVKLSTLTLQCLSWMLKMDLPQIQALVPEICTSLFSILHQYFGKDISKGNNYDLVMAAFKAMSTLVRDVKCFTVTTDQLKKLLIYADENLFASDRQATAFGLLKAIIHRKHVVPEMHKVMEKVAELSITSELENVRKQARAVFYYYLVDYVPLGKRVKESISFYLAQLAYEVQPGRLSAIEMIYSIVTGFPLEALEQQAEHLFKEVGARLENDEDLICKKACAKCIEEMLIRLPKNSRNKLFKLTTNHMKDNRITYRKWGATLCSLFVTVEKDEFESRFKVLLPLITKQFYATENFDDDHQPGRFVKIQKQEEKSDDKIKDYERLKDHHLFQVLSLLFKISVNCAGFLQNEKYREYVNTFAEYSQSFLMHLHTWVQLRASQLLGIILASLDTEKIIRLMNNPEAVDPDDGFVYSNPVEKIRSLILDSVAQLRPDSEFEELYDQTIKNLIFLARLLKISSNDQEEVKKEDESNKEEKNKDESNNEISLLWLIKKLRRHINLEMATSPKSTIVRSSVFKWMAGIIATIDIDLLRPILFHFISPLVREMSTTEESNAPLRQLAKEVATMIKKKIDIEEYARLLSQAQRNLDTRRAGRKKVLVQQYVTHPELAAKRKIAKQQKKKQAKKRKLETMKGKKSFRKKPRKEVDLEAA